MEAQRLQWYPHAAKFRLCNVQRPIQTYAMFHQVLWCFCSGRKPSFGPISKEGEFNSTSFGHLSLPVCVEKSDLNDTLIQRYSTCAVSQEQYRPMACLIQYSETAAVGENLFSWRLFTSWRLLGGRRVEWHTHISIFRLLYVRRVIPTYGMLDQELWRCRSGRKPSCRMTFHILAHFGPKRKEGDSNDTLIHPYSACAMS